LRCAVSPQDRLLLGIDLRKDREVLERAYDDSAGVTARFNLNLLERINRELGGEFRAKGFLHRAVWNEQEGRVEMHLVSPSDQSVSIRDLEMKVEFAAGESIHTENSYKYSQEEIEQLAARANFSIERRWFDEKNFFSLNFLVPRPAECN